ncbi:MAG: cytochrome d ubiquinol oxidase subunit II [Fibrobacterota bacterium]|nr:MAG: cytochrome d ubiquinol oxidase subunit II [Fibrobacterota bacterium]
MNPFNDPNWMPWAFALLLGLSFLLYAVLDGYDLGVGMLSPLESPAGRDRMVGAIGPFWDANETWLVLGVGILLVAFPRAHGEILQHLYLPVALLLIALIFRGVSFEFRKKAPESQQPHWNKAFFAGSLVASLSQGWMVGRFVTGFQPGVAAIVFAVLFSGLVVASHLLMGASWLVLKTEADLQKRALAWTRHAITAMLFLAFASSVAILATDSGLRSRMLSFPGVGLVLLLPLFGAAITVLVRLVCDALPLPDDRLAWLPFASAVAIQILGFAGLVFGFYPDIIPGRMGVTQAAASNESLGIILVGTAIVFPILIAYTVFSYWVFRGKATDLSYGQDPPTP